MRVALAGEGAIAESHASAISRIKGVDIVTLAGGNPRDTKQFASKYAIPHWSTELAECLAQPGVQAVILATPTQLHASQARQCLRAGMHTLIEIPMADNLDDSEALVRTAKEANRVAMVCHTRRFSLGHQWLHKRVLAGDIRVRHLVATTFFLRRENRNALGKPRSWTDHLLWHHACHTVDLFHYQTGERPHRTWGLQGPRDAALDIAMDMSIGLATPSGAICTLALSFNYAGPFGTTFTYICDEGTFVARYDELTDGNGKPLDVATGSPSLDGIEAQDREFFAAISDGREPNASVQRCLPAMETLDGLSRALDH